jgi:3',5'-cyclic AMP phosphodiesterase CpdA
VPEDPVPSRGDLRVVVISDLNGSYGSTEYEPEVHRAVALIRERWRPDLVLIAGDMIAGQRPTLPDDEVRAMWSAFDGAVARPLREADVPLAVTLGNHDGSAYPAHARDRRLALEHWRAPERRPHLAYQDSAGFPVRYTFRHRGLFVLVWDASNAELARDPEALAWVEAQLASDAARGARHRLVLGHLPLYAVAEGRNLPGEVLREPDGIRALLQRHGVDSYVSGHHHAYYPGRRGSLELLHAGALGQGPRPLLCGTARPMRTVTVLDFFPGRDRPVYTTYSIDNALEAEPREVEDATLPAGIRGTVGYVVRRDVDHGAAPMAEDESCRE